MNKNQRIADTYDAFVEKIEQQIESRFPDITWILARFENMQAIDKTSLTADGDEQPTGIIIAGMIAKTLSEFESKDIFISNESLAEDAISDDGLVFKLCAKMRMELFASIT